MKKKILVLCSILAFSLTLSACSISVSNDNKTATKEVHESKVIELKDEKELSTKINMAVGNLNITSDTEKLFDGSFDYNIKALKPVISYENGNLSVSNEGHSNIDINKNNSKCNWNLNFNSKIPTKMDLQLGVGKSSLDFSKMNLKELTVNTGVCDTTIDLSGNYSENIPVKIDGGVGKVKIIFSKSIGTSIKVKKGIGSINYSGFNKDNDTYTNDSYGKSKNSMEVTINTGVGEVDLELK